MSTALRTPVDEYLARQRDMSAVEAYASHHDAATGSLHAGWYEALMPATAPGPGQQYRFEVDMDACTSCKACVTACHSLNGLDVGESWRSVGIVIGRDAAGPTQQTVTTACHHCIDPACLAGCPVDAYDKDATTGIVRHLDDQCIGCTYCTWTCPYEVPRFNERLGIVRKCDMCADRLGAGEAPACVQACPNGAIAIGIVDVADLRAATTVADVLVPGAPSSALTIPTTEYRRRRPLDADAVATDAWSARPGHAHGPLALMLVLTQVSVGTLGLVAALAAGLGGDSVQLDAATQRWCALVGLTTGVVALGASVGHLGRPFQAWRAVIGVGHSWLSREIVAFGAFAATAAAAAVVRWVEPADAPAWTAADGLGFVAAGVGTAAVACSVMVYAVTGRRWWRLDRTARQFAATTIAGGASITTLLVVFAAADLRSASTTLVVLAVVAAATMAASLGADAWILRPGGPADPYLARSATLLRHDLARPAVARLVGGVVGGLGVPLLLVALTTGEPAGRTQLALIALVGVAALIAGELAARRLFFQAMVAPRMPGTPR